MGIIQARILEVTIFFFFQIGDVIVCLILMGMITREKKCRREKENCWRTLSMWTGKQSSAQLQGVALDRRVYVCVGRCVSCSVVLNSATHREQPARLLCPWESPGKYAAVGCHALLQGIFLTQGSNLSLLHCRQILHHLSYRRTNNIFTVPRKETDIWALVLAGQWLWW